MLHYFKKRRFHMYHVVFCANDNYIKYLAPLCYSIVKNAANNTQYDKGESINVTENITMGGGGQTPT